MLRLRVLTAIALLAVLVPAVFYPAVVAFASVAGLLMACGAWEWFRLNGAGRFQSMIAGAGCAVTCGVLWGLHPPAFVLQWVWSASAVIWVAGGVALIRAGVPAWTALDQNFRQLTGFAVLCAAWLAVVSARIQGVNFLFSVLALVWVADIGAYFVGRSLGGRFFKQKLAPDISPGKTREGAVGGIVGVLLLAVLWIHVDRSWVLDSPSIYTILAAKHWVFLVLAVLFLGVMSISGDLLESLVKRAAGAKDSSQLLPGHGGVLDRVDALLPVVPLAMFLQSFSSLPL
ncbi:phosphatidate cytidylyltransferase [Rhodoferax mekongensis]|uniref:phosphatidate cytidylyltransferase n=1 Tax=Rhodoferax mekongensis TaxID=3068341 RepID=UPI0028BDDCC3|nr:phosphatidate cytidylyltransferase [Rhodoferax sp. TBRC 17199]MDT7515979.1 phosphatidate cytidylyltransferase [Rhodoferax sp. TBRC 17199]